MKETIDMTPSWAFAALACATNLRHGSDFETQEWSQGEVIRMGKLLDAALAYMEIMELTDGYKEYLRAYKRGQDFVAA